MIALRTAVRRNIRGRDLTFRNKSTELTIGDVSLKREVKNLPRVTAIPDFFNLGSLPSELMLHLRWMTQKYSMGQDLFLCGHPGPLRRRLALTFANAAGLEVEYVAISRDTTENDLKQRREIKGNSVVFHDQAPVRAAIHGRLLILDGIEYAERNVLPTLNNLLENREMALEDGRFLTTQANISSIKGSSSSSLVAVHPDFRVIALGQCVPPYMGRTMDPPLRSRFQSRFVDELSSESVLELFSKEFLSLDKKKVQEVIDFYESLRIIRANALHESSAVSLTGLPVFSIDNIASCLNLLSVFPRLSVSEAIKRCVPGGFWMSEAIPSKFKPGIRALFDKIQAASSDSGIYKVSRFAASSVGESIEKQRWPLAVFECDAPAGSDGLVGGMKTRLGLSSEVDNAKTSVTLSVPSSLHNQVSSSSASHFDDLSLNLKSNLQRLMTGQSDVLSNMIADHALGQHICVLGPRGSGKSHLARVFATTIGARTRTFPLYQEVTARDLLQRRITESDTHITEPSPDAGTVKHPIGTNESNRTSWVDSPLIAAARNGDLCVLDGVDRVDPQIMFTLRMLLQDGVVDLPSGERLSTALYATDPNSPLAIKPGFRVLALGLSPSPLRHDDTRDRYISSSLGFAYHHLPAASTVDMMHIVDSLKLNVSTGAKVSEKSAAASEELRKAVVSLERVASEHVELKLSLRHLLRLSRLISSEKVDADAKATLEKTLKRTLMISFMPSVLSSKFYSSLHLEEYQEMKHNPPVSNPLAVIVNESTNSLQIGDVSIPRRASARPELIPRPIFHENAAHIAMLQELMHAFSAGERSLLLIGNQGVGKNKLVDRLLQLMNAEREYIQLHRDTTIQSLTLLPTLDAGKIVYEDSPMVRAARLGRILVVDEADKAPLEVVCILKALAEDGEVILYDGRRLLSRARLLAEGGDLNNPPSDVVVIHPDFALFVLANRPGFPFLGNNFFRECGDAFSVHVVENLDYKSEIELLSAYGPNVHVSILSKLAASFAALREAHGRGDITYPFSVREAVSVVKHIQMYPQDGVAAAVEDILGFDSLTPILRSQIAEIFQANGLPVPLHAAGTIQKTPPVSLSSSFSLPTPSIFPISLESIAKSERVQFSNPRHLKRSEWTSNVTAKSPFSVESSRLVRFSEEIGRVYLGKNHEDARDSLWTGRVSSMVADNSDPLNGVVHVLTSDPLTIHSFTNLGAAADAMRGGAINPAVAPQLIRRELLSEEMSFRLGSVQPILVPLATSTASEFPVSCAVLVPDLSMALVVSKDPADPVQMVQIPLKTFGQATSAKYRDVVRMFGGGSGQDREERTGRFAACSSIDKPGEVILYSSGGQGGELHLIDFNSFTVRTADIGHSLPRTTGSNDDVGIQSVSSIGNGNWIIVSSHGEDNRDVPAPSQYNRTRSKDVRWQGEMQTSIMNIATDGGQLIIRKLSQDAANANANANILSVFGHDGYGSHIVSKSYAGTGINLVGSSVTHGSTMSQQLESLHTWQRQAIAAHSKDVVQSMRVGASYFDSVANVIASKEENAVSKKAPRGSHLTPVEVTLEAVDLKEHQYKRIDLSRPVNSIDPMLSVVSIAPVATQCVRSQSSDDVEIDERLRSSVLTVLHADGVIRLFETDSASLKASQTAWEALFGSQNSLEQWKITRKGFGDGADGAMRDLDKDGKPRTGLNSPKHGKEDPKNEPHVGGNTWAGGTGGSDTAGLGGRGGPYRLDKGHTVHQVSDEMKAAVSTQGREQAAKIAKEALAKRLEDIKMGRNDYDTYMKYKHNIETQIGQLRATFEELSRRSQERIWLRNQTQGDLDDSKLVDGLTGDRLVFKRRGVPDTPNPHMDNSGDNAHKKRLQFVVDVSGSMYRFNGQDRRLERMLEAVLLLMESMPSAASSKSDATAANSIANIDYCISGHSGDSYKIPFLDFHMPKPSNEQERLEVLESMVAHSQYCSSGDNTLNAVSKAVDNILIGTEDDQKMDRYVFVMSDANFERYGISPTNLARQMTKDKRVKVHFILIASLADEAERVARALPAGQAHVCFDTASIPNVLKSILTSTFGGALDV